MLLRKPMNVQVFTPLLQSFNHKPFSLDSNNKQPIFSVSKNNCWERDGEKKNCNLFNSLQRPCSIFYYNSCNYSSITMTAVTCPILHELCLLEKQHVKIRQPESVEQLLQKMVNGGMNSLQVVADYDYTITRVHDGDGVRCHCSWGALDNSDLLPDFYRSETHKLLEKYYPIETSATMTEAEKIPHMIDWYTQVNKLLERCHLSKKDLVTIVANSNTKLRTGTEELLETLHGSSVPLLVFSAGMGDIIVNVFDKFKVNSDNVKIVSNFFKFNEEDNMIGFQGEMIHVFNKNESAFHSSPYFGELKGRTNILLMGDSLGDIKMTEGVPTPNNSLKIGFLNEKMERLPAYEAAYDIVLLDDQTMDVANNIVQLILRGQ